ncbi:hypothetical protein L249_8599 [Ophiocordyceps polyrhachis-furcata BCC 54312]|uniref:FAD/NAD(P)-binding domain-containing protein n=1 Tax=Ophiocordyceps polyrhachis-furcata BCC 54312 TaxID=1330021 RepID=A0A367L6V7_9HYPO|nr:hypothetical protein L249_8599 [Ophiocordyceps polyrhachis-furcata BCC 54312]
MGQHKTTSSSSSNDITNLNHVTDRYVKEKSKRLRSDGNAQYVDLGSAPSARLRELARDPWVDDAKLNSQPSSLEDGDTVKVLILGAGYGGLLFAVRLIDEAAIPAEDIRLVDPAGGFGGTWYWNRYPGLMCDVESAIYMPLLEETGHMPRHRYAYGPELRLHAEAIARRWRLSDKAVFRTTVSSLVWEDEEAGGRWQVKLRQSRGPSEAEEEMSVRAQFVVLAHGVHNRPKAPRVPGLADFQGELMHTARWKYAVSGGSDQDPALTGLSGKRVGVIGTGATAVQLVPELARWAGRLFVFQRTPSAVDERRQRPWDPEAWKAMTAKKGWWRDRADSWNRALSGYPEPGRDGFEDDAWLGIHGYRHVVGGPHPAPLPIDAIPAVVGAALAADEPRMERLRRRVDEVVTQDEAAAEALKAWYPSWCKRPCFHDDYLVAFNRPHVSVVDTLARGIDRFTEKGVIVSGVEYGLDIVVLATGYRSPSTSMMDPGGLSHGVSITGRSGVDLSSRWLRDGPSTLHGILTPGFPNLVLTGPSQTGVSANYAHHQDNLARHFAHILSKALSQCPNREKSVVIEATEAAAAAWTGEIASRAAFMAPMGFCGPSYSNNEGEPVADPVKMARASPYGLGVNEFENVLDRWRSEGSMEGLVVSCS